MVTTRSASRTSQEEGGKTEEEPGQKKMTEFMSGTQQEEGGGGEEEPEQGGEEPGSEPQLKRARVEAAANAQEKGAAEEGGPAEGGEQAAEEEEQVAEPAAEPEGAAKETGAEEEQGAAEEKGAEEDKGAAGEEGAKAEGLVEDGRIYFFFRPKVGVEEASSIGDVQRFFMVLQPKSERRKARLCVMGKKRMPSAAAHERFFGFVEAASERMEDLTEGLGEKTYETKTRGTRHVAAARALGSGVYSILEHRGQTNLVYRLELPEEPGEAQSEFEIGKDGSYVLSIKNPERSKGTRAAEPAPDPGLGEKADFPQKKRKEFANYAWIPCHDPELLEYEHAEFLLIGAKEDVKAELGEKAEQVEELARQDKEQLYGAESDEEEMLQKMRQEIQADKIGIETAPVETGELK